MKIIIANNILTIFIAFIQLILSLFLKCATICFDMFSEFVLLMRLFEIK